MQQPSFFKKIVLGVDLSQGDRLVSEEVPPPSQAAMRRAIALGRELGAEVHFAFALDLGYRTQQLIRKTQGLSENVLDRARNQLRTLADEASQSGVTTQATVQFGKSWEVLIQLALREEADLVMVGTRHFGRLHYTLVGSTGMHLLRACPCPVWIAQPSANTELENILIATDFSPACDRALLLSSRLAALYQAKLELMHVLDLPPEEEMDDLLEGHTRFRDFADEFESEAESDMDKQVAGLPDDEGIVIPEQVLLHGKPSAVIVEQTRQRHTHLLVMGTVARSGFPGLLMGNTAERLLPHLDCSILAVKPPDFVSPVTVEK